MNKIVGLAFFSILLCSCQPVEKENTSGQQKENIELVNQFFEHFNNHDWKSMASMYADDADFLDPSLGTTVVKQTPEETASKYAALNEMFPDIHDEVIRMFPSGDEHIIVEFVSTGTAPDSSKFTLPICTVFLIKKGKIAADYTYYDNSN